MIKKESNDWKKEYPRKWFSTPYSFKEGVLWVLHNMLKPCKKYKKFTKFIPQDLIISDINPKISLCFIGDIMKMGKRELKFSNELKKFIDTDYLIGNFEGTISSAKKVFMAQDHNPSIIEYLKNLYPPSKFILTCANNHSGDFGWTEFNKSYNLLKENGFLVIGRRDEPFIILNNTIKIAVVSKWSNQPCKYIPNFNDLDDLSKDQRNFNILYPHWGYEMQLYPNLKQIELAKNLLLTWDLIIGHHSHCPQPVTLYNINNKKKLIAYSLGNFCANLKLKRYNHGIIIKVKIGPDKNGFWNIGNISWRFTKINHINKNETIIELSTKSDLFKDIEFLEVKYI